MVRPIFNSNARTRRHRPAHQEAQTESVEPFFQPKLSINQPGDPYEREADAVADQVVNQNRQGTPMQGNQAIQRRPISSIQRLSTPDEEKMPATNDARMAEDKQIQEKPEIQRAEAPKEEENPVQKAEMEKEEPVQKAEKEEETPIQKMDAPKEEDPVQKAEQKEEEPIQKMDAPKEEENPVQKAEMKEEEPVQKAEQKEEEKGMATRVQTKSKSDTPTQATPDFSTRLSSRRGQGEPLPAATRTQMEKGIGADFSQVRIHTDSEAAQMSDDIQAQAFTNGKDVYFNAGKYDTGSTEGQRLLAHELTHVVQQASKVQKASDDQSSPVAKPATTKEHGTSPAPADVMSSCQIATTSPSGEQFVPYSQASHQITPQLRRITDHFVEEWRIKGANASVRIDGYASMEGEEDYNWRLSCRRATTIKNALMHPGTQTTGIPESFIQIFAHGETNRFDAQQLFPNRRATITSVIPVKPDPPTVPTVPAFVCFRPLDTSPIGNHAFFRMSSTISGNDTYSLEPQNTSSDCWQGIPDKNYPSDRGSTTATCVRIPGVTETEIQREHHAYSHGRYCTWGPNSNSYVGHILTRVGSTPALVTGNTPGLTDSPPPAGTFAPDKWSTLIFGCGDCTPVIPESPQKLQTDCLKRLEICNLPGGIPTEEQIHLWNTQCKDESHYEGPDLGLEICDSSSSSS